MTWPLWIAAALGALAAFAWISARLMRNPWGTVEGGLLKTLGTAYLRGLHRLRVLDPQHIPRSRAPGPLVVAANHTAGIDPLLIQAACPFPIRWMMAQDMRHPAVNWFLDWLGVIFVDRTRAEVKGIRTAMRHLQQGGVIGVFPEGGLERPPRMIRQFQTGAGLLIHRTKCPVLPVVVDGTPRGETAWSSLTKPSRSTVRFLPVLAPGTLGESADQIARNLRKHFLDATGWPPNDAPLLPPGLEGRVSAHGLQAPDPDSARSPVHQSSRPTAARGSAER